MSDSDQIVVPDYPPETPDPPGTVRVASAHGEVLISQEHDGPALRRWIEAHLIRGEDLVPILQENEQSQIVINLPGAGRVDFTLGQLGFMASALIEQRALEHEWATATTNAAPGPAVTERSVREAEEALGMNGEGRVLSALNIGGQVYAPNIGDQGQVEDESTFTNRVINDLMLRRGRDLMRESPGLSAADAARAVEEVVARLGPGALVGLGPEVAREMISARKPLAKEVWRD